jgi:hypothetical protein
MFGDEPNAPIVTNDKGGKQSDIPVRMDLIPARELLELGKILKAGGEKYGDWNWLKIDVNSHLNHALHHIYAFLNEYDEAGFNKSKEHYDKLYVELTHALCRLLFASTKFRVDGEKSEFNKLIEDNISELEKKYTGILSDLSSED